MRENEIKEFKEFIDSCFESLDSNIPVHYSMNNDLKWIGEFIIDDSKYGIEIEKITEILESKVYTTKFYEKLERRKEFLKKDIDDFKKSLKVLGTVNNTLLDFIKNINPDVLFFYTSDDNTGREKLYSRFSAKIEKQFNYYSFKHKIHNLTFYFICDNDYNILDLKKYFDTIYNIVS